MSSVLVTVDQHVATVTLNRPPVNALDQQAYAELTEAFRAVRFDREVRVVVLQGSPNSKAFCAGVDLNSVGAKSQDAPLPQVLDAGTGIRDLLTSIFECPVPVVCAVDGAAIGAGFGLVSMCDIIIASERSTFGFTEMDVGLLGGISHLTYMVGRYRARRLFFTAARISAQELFEWGVVSDVVPSGQVEDRVTALVETLRSKSPVAMRYAKESMIRTDFLPVMEGYRIEQEYTVRLAAFADSVEARSAYRGKRAPNWTYT